MSIMKRALWVLLSLAGSAAAQAPSTPQTDPKSAAPAVSITNQSTTPGQRTPTPSRNQFFSPVMGVNIEGQGLGLPRGVAEDEPIKPAAEPPATASPTAK